MTRLALEGVSKRYRETTALEDVSLTVADGEFFTLVGPSGCGKTTTLRTIAGFEDPTAGEVRFDGRSVTGLAPEERDVGVVFQNYALFPHMSVAENISYGLQFRDSEDTSSEERVAELLGLVDLAGMGDREPAQLSGGQQQRVALARALAPEPSLLLLDEPMSALDARLRESLRRQVRRIQTDLGITTVYVTHDQEEALAVSDRVAVMHAGGIEQVGTPEAIYRRPATRFVAKFVGDNNVLAGEVRAREDGHLRVAVSGGEFAVADPSVAGGGEDGDEGDGKDEGNNRVESPPTAGDRITFCVRPEALRADAEANRIRVRVETSEFHGESVRVDGRWGETPIILRLPDVPDRKELTVGFDPEAAHVVRREGR